MAEPETDRPDEAPSGMPDESTESDPMGVPEAAPEGEDDPRRGEDAMPGIPSEGEPPGAS